MAGSARLIIYLNFSHFLGGKYAHWEREGALGRVVDWVLVVLPYFRLLLVSTTDDLDVSGSQVFLAKLISFWMSSVMVHI